MENLTHHWRPLPTIRTKAIGIIQQDGDILVCAIPRDDGTIKGWRPLDGSIEFGEAAAQTVVRELHEEIRARAQVTGQLGVLENIYTHEGEQGHEIMFLMQTNLLDAGAAAAPSFVVTEDNGTRHAAAWVPLADFHAGHETLFPDCLLTLL